MSQTALLFVIALGLAAWQVMQSIAWGVAWAAFALVAIYGQGRGWWLRLAAWANATIRPFLAQLFARKQLAARRQMYDVLLGYDEATGQPIIENLESLKSIIFAGTSGFGKTTWAQNFVDDLLSHHSANDLRLAIGDVKRVSYGPWRDAPHLVCPIAKTKAEHKQMITAVLNEMERRGRLFEFYEDRFCESLDDYYRLSGVQLPRLVVVIDELADAIQPGDIAHDKLITLLKMGRFVGVHVVMGTQRPSARILTGEIVSQVVTKLFTYMPNNREFGVVSMVPKELYDQATPTPGRFMLYTTRGQWRFMRVRRGSREAMAKRAARLAGRPRRWAEEVGSEPTWDELGDNEKAAMMRAWIDGRERTPSLSELMAQFQISRPTAIKYRRMAMNGDGW